MSQKSEGRFYDPEIETMDRDKLENLQLERFKWQMRRCYQNSQFYREKFDEAGVKPEDIKTLADLIRVPVVTKQELREEQASHPPFGRYTVSPPEHWREVHPTTGTTGAPLYNLWSEEDVRIITDWTKRTLWSFGVRPGDIVQNAFSYGLWVAGMSTHYAAKELGCLVVPISSAPADRQIDYLRGIGAGVLLATPSFALYMADRLRTSGVSPDDIALRLGCFGGEAGAAVASTRERIEKGLGIDAFDYYGLAEIGPTCASECEEKAGIHWAEDHVLVETIDPETGERCSPGAEGVLVLTHLTKEAMPMIRYWTNDLARLETERCTCGRTLARSPGGILGRADDMVTYRGAKFYPVQVENVLRAVEGLGDEYKIRLTTDEKRGTDVCTVVIECLDEVEDKEGLRLRLRAALREEIQVGPNIEFVESGTLERATFKAKRIEDNRKRD